MTQAQRPNVEKGQCVCGLNELEAGDLACWENELLIIVYRGPLRMLHTLDDSAENAGHCRKNSVIEEVGDG